MTKKWPEVCSHLHRNALTPVGGTDNVSCMLTLCPSCNHALWLEVHSLGTFRSVVYFDDDEGSDT